MMLLKKITNAKVVLPSIGAAGIAATILTGCGGPESAINCNWVEEENCCRPETRSPDFTQAWDCEWNRQTECSVRKDFAANPLLCQEVGGEWTGHACVDKCSQVEVKRMNFKGLPIEKQINVWWLPPNVNEKKHASGVKSARMDLFCVGTLTRSKDATKFVSYEFVVQGGDSDNCKSGDSYSTTYRDLQSMYIVSTENASLCQAQSDCKIFWPAGPKSAPVCSQPATVCASIANANECDSVTDFRFAANGDDPISMCKTNSEGKCVVKDSDLQMYCQESGDTKATAPSGNSCPAHCTAIGSKSTSVAEAHCNVQLKCELDLDDETDSECHWVRTGTNSTRGVNDAVCEFSASGFCAESKDVAAADKGCSAYKDSE